MKQQLILLTQETTQVLVISIITHNHTYMVTNDTIKQTVYNNKQAKKLLRVKRHDFVLTTKHKDNNTTRKQTQTRYIQ